jgi:DNA-binding transcriptional LysR family regulator
MTLIKILDNELPLKLEWLRTFVAVADTGGFSRAARRLRRSQPAVSTHVKELEANLGAVLFETRGSRTTMTPAGEIVRREAQQILDQAVDLVAAVHEAEKTVGGVVRLAASTTPASYVLPAAMVGFEDRFPGARTSLAVAPTGRVLELVRANQADLGIVGLEPKEDEFVATPFVRDELVLIASARDPLAGRRRVRTAELDGRRLLVREAGSATRRLGESWLSASGIHPAIMELGGPETVKRAVAAGLGIGILSRLAVEWEIEQGRLSILNAAGLPIRRHLYIVSHRKKRISRSIASFVEVLRTVTRKRRP